MKQAQDGIKSKRVCIVNFYVYNIFVNDPQAVFGGAEVQFYHLMKELERRAEYNVSVLDRHTGKSEIIKKDGITFWKLYDARNKPLKKLYNILKCLWYFRKINADVYITRAASIYVGLAVLYCKLSKKKSVFMTAHSLDVDGSFIRDNSWLARKLYLYGLKNADVIIAQNHDHVNLLEKNYHKHSIQIPNSFSLPERSVISNSPDTILWVGRSVAWKHPERFIDLAKRYPQEKFIMIIIPQDDVILKPLKEKVAQLSNVELIPGVSFFEIDKYFNQCKLFVNTSSAEGFPNTFIQAGMYARPILSYAVNPDGVLTKNNMGWMANNDQTTFLRLADNIINNSALLKESGKNARSYVERTHDINKNVEKILDQL